MQAFHTQLDAALNVFTIDHRSTGQSNPLNCTSSAGTPADSNFQLSEIQACANELKDRYGSLDTFDHKRCDRPDDLRLDISGWFSNFRLRREAVAHLLNSLRYKTKPSQDQQTSTSRLGPPLAVCKRLSPARLDRSRIPVNREFTDDYANNSVQAQCVIYNAPMCYPGVCEADSTKTLEVFVKRIQAVNNADNAPNVWFLQGGPGYSSIAMEQLMVDLHAILRGTVNVYTMDHRGTGRSSFLDCIASQATTAGSPRGNDFDLSKVPGCAQELEIKYGSDLSMFSITSAANGMASFISTFLADSTTFVYGVSYGTAVVERLIHLAPKEVVGYILDGVSTTSGSDLSNFAYFSSWDQQFNKVGNAYVDLCTEDPTCSKYFSFSNLSSVGRNLVSSFDKEPDPQCVTILREYLPDSSDNDEPGHLLRMELAKVLEDFESREKIPKLIYLLSKCEGEDDAASGYLSLRKLSDKQQSLMEAASLESDYRSQLLYYLIMFSELWEVPQVSQTTMLERFTNATIAFKMMNYANLYCAFSKENSMACADFPSSAVTSAEYQPIVYQRDQY